VHGWVSEGVAGVGTLLHGCFFATLKVGAANCGQEADGTSGDAGADPQSTRRKAPSRVALKGPIAAPVASLIAHMARIVAHIASLR